MAQITYFDFEKYAFTEIINPSAQDIQYRLDALGKDKESHFTLTTSFGGMGFTEASEGRVMLKFSRQGNIGVLLDPNYPEGSRKIEIAGDPEGGARSIRKTVTKEKAYEVTVYLLEHDQLPQGLSWWGPLNKVLEQDSRE